MDPEPKTEKAEKGEKKGVSSYSKTWNQFMDKAMPILIENPTQARYTLKYIPRYNQFILKVTDGPRLIMKRCHASEQYEQIQKFTRLATKALTNEAEPQKSHQHEDKALKESKKKKKKK